MGTHPIFESDFDCLTEMFRSPVYRFASSDSSNELIVERLSGDDEGIAIIGFNRPKAMNSLSKNLLGLFKDAINDVKFDQNLRCVILRSMSGRAFCTGADLKERATMPAEEVGPFVSGLRATVREFQELPM